MVLATLAGTVGVYAFAPFYGVFVYYLFAVLRPQHMWKWSLPEGITWSLFVALSTIGAAVLGLLGVIEVPGRRPAQPEGEALPHQASTGHHAMLLFGLWICASFALAQNRDVAAPWFEEYVKIFLMYAVSAYLVRTVRQVWALFLMTGLVLGYIAYEVNYLYIVNNYLGIYRNGYGGLDNNGAGLMLAMGVPLCWFSYEGFHKKWWRWGFVLLIPVIVHAVLMTYSRGAMLSLVVMCPALLWHSRQRVRLGLALGAFVFLLIPVLAGAEIQARFLTIESHEVDESANSRKQSWAAAWNMAKDYPIFGVGVRNANLFSQQYGADMEGRTIHSQYLQVAADNGLVGLALYLALFAAAWLSLHRCRRHVAGRTDAEARAVVAAAAGIECSLAVYAFGSIFLSLEVFELPYLLLLLTAQLEVTSAPGPAPLLLNAGPGQTECQAPLLDEAPLP
jgi:probable O-glycosylation ligase (exosortase A-associated)